MANYILAWTDDSNFDIEFEEFETKQDAQDEMTDQVTDILDDYYDEDEIADAINGEYEEVAFHDDYASIMIDGCNFWWRIHEIGKK